MSHTHDEVRALRVMVDELRAEPPPELDWDAIEQRLQSRLGVRSAASGLAGLPSVTCITDMPAMRVPTPSLAQPVGRRLLPATRASSALTRVFGFAAAAAVLAIGVGSMMSNAALPSAAAPPRHVIEATKIAVAPGSSVAHDLSALSPGDVVEAGDAPVTFAEAGLARWMLAPGSALRVRSVGVGHTVVLERGSIRAEVTPRDASEGLVEAFAVEVAGTRVAVHGTAFSVTLENGRVVVDVDHGAVAVGPVGYAGATTGHLLVGPSRASFSLDGGRSARLMERVLDPAVLAEARQRPTNVDDVREHAPTHVDDVREPPAAILRAADGAVAAAPKPGLATHAPAHQGIDTATVGGVPEAAVPEASAELPRLTIDVIRARIMRCFKQNAAADPAAMRVSVSSTLHIELNKDGTYRRGGFTQALKPELTNCVGGAIAGRYSGEVHELDVPVTFQP